MSKIMAATEPADVAQMAVIECLRQIADNGKKTAQVLEGVQSEVRDVRERLIRIEASETKEELKGVKADLTSLTRRIEKLEANENRREGAQGFADAILKYGPFVIAVVTALFILLVATKKIVI